MAKRKDSVALFEVITATKRREAAAAAAAGSTAKPVLRTPKWWFKSKNRSDASSQGGEAFDAPALPAAPAYPPSQLAAPVESSPVGSSGPAPSLVQRVAAVAPERLTIPERAGDVDPFGLDVPERSADPTRRTPWLSRFRVGGVKKLGIDPDRREVTLRFRYTTAIIVGFAICVIVGLAYVTGRQTNRASAEPNPVSSAAIKNGPIMSDVLNIRPDGKSGDEPGNDVIPPPQPPPGTRTDQGASKKPAALPPRVSANPGMPTSADGVETVMPRVKGLNYAIMQSYPDEKSALEAQRFLEGEGIPCTIERGLKGWDPDLHIVVGIHGFPTVYKNTTAYKNYLRAVESASKKFVGNKRAKPFAPTGIRWN